LRYRHLDMVGETIELSTRLRGIGETMLEVE
jgi:hypothetical protein